MKITPPQTSDADDLLNYFRTLVKVDGERVERPEDVSVITREQEVRWIESLVDRAKRGDGCALLVRADDGALVGLGELERRPRWIERHVAEIRFGLLPNRPHEGASLVRQLLSEAKSQEIELLYYFHLESQAQGIGIIKDAGFRLAGKISGYYKKKGAYIDRVFYEKKI